MPGRLPSEFISELLNRVDIVQVVQSHVPLKKYGREFRASCPFHTERTPSFYVSPAKQFYHCFGCGKSGTAISFLMEYSNLGFMNAVEELASLAGMQIPTNQSTNSNYGDTTRLIELMEQVQAAFKEELLSSESESVVKSYIRSRQFTPQTIMHFGVGFAPDRWDYVLKKFGRSKSGLSLLHKAGLVIRNEKDREYDRFRNRLMFPIYDRRGRVIGFGGRILDSSEPKYLNSPETVLFKKSNELFGLYHAAKAIKDAGKVILVEGYTDVLALHQFGIENSVATLGTATTSYHIRELFKATSQIVFCFDGDFAGRKAAWRAMQSSLAMMHDGRLASFVFLPNGQDPDSFIREYGAEEFQNLIENSEPIAEFIFRMLMDNVDMDRLDGKAKFVKEFASIYIKMPDATLRELMKNELHARTGLSDAYLQSILQPKRSYQRNVQTDLDVTDLTNRALALLVQNPELSRSVKKVENLIDFRRGQNTRLLVEVLSRLKANPDMSTAALIEEYRDSKSFALVRRLTNTDHRAQNGGYQEEFLGMISKIQSLGYQQKVKLEISDLTRQSHSESQEEAAARLQKLLVESRKAFPGYRSSS